MNNNYIAFESSKLVAEGEILTVLVEVKKRLIKKDSQMILLFDATTGKQIDFDLSGTLNDVKKRFTSKPDKEESNSPKVGRPKLGVISKEISLLPKHWEWLALQQTSASVTLRRLIEEAQKRNKDVDTIRLAQEATYRFMSTMVGDLIGYEDAIRALYAREEKTFNYYLINWPKDIQTQIKKFSHNVFFRK